MRTFQLGLDTFGDATSDAHGNLHTPTHCLSRFNMKYSNGTLSHEKLMRSIELYGTQVAPRVREANP